MRANTQARPRCAFCGDFMPFWPPGAPATTCTSCRRPLILFPASLRRARYRILSVVDVAKVILLPVVGGAVVAFGLARMTPLAFANVVSIALLVWGTIDVWDGTSGLESGVDRVRRKIRSDRTAKRISIAKTLFGGASIALGAVGLLLAS